MSLSQVWTALLVPPVNLLLVAIAGWFVGRSRRLGRFLLAMGLVGLLALALPIVSANLIMGLERGLNRASSIPGSQPPQAIVILSGDVSRNDGALVVGSLTLEREQAGAALQRRTGLPILVSGGVAGRGNTTLAALMSRSLTEDFQAHVQFTEQQSRDTRQNAVFSAAILRAQDIHSIYLVTHAWHMRRALLDFADTGIAVTPAPVRWDGVPPPDLGSFVPRASAWMDSYFALHEWIGAFVQPYRAE